MGFDSCCEKLLVLVVLIWVLCKDLIFGVCDFICDVGFVFWIFFLMFWSCHVLILLYLFCGWKWSVGYVQFWNFIGLVGGGSFLRFIYACLCVCDCGEYNVAAFRHCLVSVLEDSFFLFLLLGSQHGYGFAFKSEKKALWKLWTGRPEGRVY